MPFDVGAMAAASAVALAVSFGLAALHYRHAMRGLQGTLRRSVGRDAETIEGDARHRVLLDHAPIGCVVWEPGFRIVDWNRQAELIFGWRRDEALGRHLIETLFREKDRAGMRQLAANLFAGAITQHGALAHVRRDGGSVVCEWHHAAVRDRDGSPVRIVSMCLDVTGVREIERENALFRSLVEHTADPAVLLLDEQDGYRVRYANAAAARHFGRAASELIGMVPSDWDPHVDAEALDQYRKAAGKDRTIAIQTEHCRADGTIVPVEVTSNAIEHAGRAYVICYVRDISKRLADEARLRALEVSAAVREHEKRHREIFEHSSDALFSIDVSPQGGLVFSSVNPAAERAFGLPAAALVGLRFDDVAARLANYIDACRECVETGMPVECEGPLDLSPEGKQASLLYATRLIPLAGDGGIERIICIGRDVTESNRIGNILNFVAQRRWTDCVDDSLGALARHLGEMLAVDYVIFDRLTEEFGVAETAALYAKGAMLPSMRYELRGTPCDNVLGKTLCRYPGNIQALFPEDALLADMKAESYVGIPLWDSAGHPIGLIAVIDGKPMEDADAVARLLQLVATRVAAELERERADRQLREREREFRSLAENSPDVIARYGRDGRRLYVNNAMTRLCGRPAEALIGAPPEDGQVVAADQIEKFSSAIRHAFATGESVRDELDLVRHDGVRRVFEGQMVPEFGPDGKVQTVLIIGHDITAFRDAERLVSRFVANVPGFAFTLHRSPEGRYGFPFASHGIEKLFGLRPRDVKDGIGPLRRMLHVSDGLDFDARLEAAAKNLASLQFEFRIAGLDGNERWIEVRGTPERESDGGILWHGVMLNVTTRKRMENDLRQRELEFRALAENSPDPIFRYDPQGRRLFANRAAASLSRRTPQDLIGKSLTEQLIIPADVAEQVRRVIGTVVETGQPQECEIDFIGPVSGVRRVMQNRYVPEFGPYGRVVSVLSMSRDITVLKETLETLSHRERSLAEAQRMGRIGSWELDLLANRLDWSDEVFRIFEIDQTRFGASYEAFLDAIHPEDRDAVNAAYTNSLKIREAYSIDHRLLMPDGRVKYVHERCETDYDADGKPLLSRGTVQDVTERTLAAMTLHQREQEFRTLAENSPDIIVRYDLRGRRTYVNQAYLASNRVAKEQVLGKTIEETAVFPPALAADFDAMLARVVAGERDDELSMTWRREDGETVAYFLRAVPEFGDDGRVASVLTVARDVTMLKETERRLVESRAELQELTARREDAREEERRRIARDLHEELGQTLSALRMSISMLPIEYAEAVPELRPRIQAMLNLTDRVLHGMRQTVMTLRPTALDAGIAAGLEWLVREFQEHAGIPCALRLDEDRIELDDRGATTLFRIAQEALTNVARHARAGRAELTLRRESGGWLLEVRDDGSGFDPKVVHEKAFGLRSMTERAQSIDGQFAILSSPGDGTVVTLRISR